MSKEAIEQKEVIVGKLKDSGCRITKQRLILLDVILEGECGSCKEIYYRASKIDRSIGTATVYRMINTLEAVSYTHLTLPTNREEKISGESGEFKKQKT